MSRVKRKEDVFFQEFQDFSALTVSAAELFLEIVEDYPNSNSRIPEVKEYETKGDDQVRTIMTTLHSSFITPFDREDISALALQMDEIVDGLENVSARFTLYDIDDMRSEAVEMAKLIVEATHHLDDAFGKFADFKKDASILKDTKSTNDVEDKGDFVYRDALATIFREHGQTVDVIKWKSLMDKIEDTLDACKDVANDIQNVIVKNG
jgi:predicted phosphate transport protein (TIGR00153 family)